MRECVNLRECVSECVRACVRDFGVHGSGDELCTNTTDPH